MICFIVIVSLTMMQKLFQPAVLFVFVFLFVLVLVSYIFAFITSRESPPHNNNNSIR